MLPAKPKSGIFETPNNKSTKATKSGLSDSPNNKTSPLTPRVSKIPRAGSTKSDSSSPSPLPSSRLSIERSPKSVDSKTAVERRTLKLNTQPDKQRVQKGSELPLQLSAVQEDLKKAGERLAVVEQEKAQALEELKDAKRLADEASEKLKEALVAKKTAEESSEIDKFRADELEQAGIDAAHKKEEEWQKELENVRNQHAEDLASLLSSTQEIQRVKHELTMTVDAKNTALSHADDAMKIAEINAEKVMVLSAEVNRLKAMLDTKMENMSSQTAELVKKLDCEVGVLKSELESAKAAEEKLLKMEASVEGLKNEVTDAKRAETDAGNLVDKWKTKVELLEVQLEEADVLANKTTDVVKKLESQVDAMRQELVKAQTAEEKLVETESLVEQLSTEVTDAKMAEAEAGKIADELKRKAELLEIAVEEANQAKNETMELVKIMDSEVEAMKRELERAKAAEDTLIEMEALVQRLKTEVDDTKRAETDACNLIDEWKRKSELLEDQLDEVEQSKKSSLDALALVSKQLEESNALLQDAESEISALKGIVGSLEEEVTRQKADLYESERLLDVAHQEALELGNTVEILKSELQTLQEEKLQALDNEKVAASNIENMSEEMNKLINELKLSKDEEEKAKKAMEGLVSALHEVSSEARETQEKLLAKQAELEDAEAQVEELKLALENTEERYEVMLDEARYEIVCLRNSAERSETESKNSRSEWDGKEVGYLGSIKKLEEEITSLKVKMEELVDSLKGAENEAQAARDSETDLMTKLREAETEMKTKLRHAESGVADANAVAEAAKAETLKLKERLLDKENELQSITQENDDLHAGEAANSEKIRELHMLLAEATAKRGGENGDHSDCENDMLSNSKDFHSDDFETKKPVSDELKLKENINGNKNEEENSMEREASNTEVTSRDLGSERKHDTESTDGELESKIDSSSSFDLKTGLPSEKTDNGAVHPKKKKDLLQKFGGLLKKKSSTHK